MFITLYFSDLTHIGDVETMRGYSQEDNCMYFLSEKHIPKDLLEASATSVVSLGLSYMIHLLTLGEVKSFPPTSKYNPMNNIRLSISKYV